VSSYFNKRTITRAAVVRAFSGPGRSRAEVRSIVTRYIGDSPVPPLWSLASVRGTFGVRVARAWARHLRHLRSATYRGENGRWLTPVVQTAYDFGTTPEALAATPPMIGELMALAEKVRMSSDTQRVPVLVDEFWRLGA